MCLILISKSELHPTLQHGFMRFSKAYVSQLPHGRTSQFGRCHLTNGHMQMRDHSAEAVPSYVLLLQFYFLFRDHMKFVETNEKNKFSDCIELGSGN